MERESLAGSTNPHPFEHEAPAAIDTVLVVEDSMIIALDTEEALTQAGVRQVKVAGNCETALAELGKCRPDFAVLDFNLGNETSERVAEALAAAGVPFCFATGYGEAMAQVAVAPPLGVLTKPYSREDLAEMLAKAALGDAA